ncbi:MAG: hypothetical protein L0219_20005 [Phycisphaerales bacterium]|nr:hypothetical protein [Phycisphaerales bacterium]MCI0675541.1 hypothetical protein [Phycisphaerales bacterium]
MPLTHPVWLVPKLTAMSPFFYLDVVRVFDIAIPAPADFPATPPGATGLNCVTPSC